jgi:hypothetical protein
VQFEPRGSIRPRRCGSNKCAAQRERVEPSSTTPSSETNSVAMTLPMGFHPLNVCRTPHLGDDRGIRESTTGRASRLARPATEPILRRAGLHFCEPMKPITAALDLHVLKGWQNGNHTSLESWRLQGFAGSNPSPSVGLTASIARGRGLSGMFALRTEVHDGRTFGLNGDFRH